MTEEIIPLTTGYTVRITSGSRTWFQQMRIILNPKYRDNYRGIKRRFLQRFQLDELPASPKALTPHQKQWWKRNILAQAGKPRGFAHVGGNAVDIVVGKLSLEHKKKLKESIEAKGYGVFLESVKKGHKARYNVPIHEANVFHVYRK